MRTTQPIIGKVQPHQRPDGTFTQHEYVYWDEDMRHQFSGYDALSRIYVCMRPMPGGRICGHEKSVRVKKEGEPDGAS
jgi:hypothetical protein